jgi:uncharacterized protein (DUF3820 family)
VVVVNVAYQRFMDMEENTPAMMDPEFMRELVHARMPFGKYSGRPLLSLPEPYVVWFKQKGFPAGKLGQQMETVYEIKLNGLEYLFADLTKFD